MPSPTLTIGLPVYNAAPFLRDCLRSVFAQSWSDWELVVVDDGSTDESLAILESIDDPRVRLVGRGLHQGLGTSLNLITTNARGRYVARMDADDMMHPSRLERQLRVLLERPDLDGVGCGMVVLDRHLEPIGTKLNPGEHAAICADPLGGIRLAHATFLGRAEWFRSHPYNENNYGCEDWELWFSTFTESRFANLLEPLYFHRELDSFTVSKYLRRQLRASFFSWRHGRDQFGMSRTAWECGKRFARGFLYASAGMLGTAELLVRRRYVPLDAASAEQLGSTIRQIRSRSLPFCPASSTSHSR
jgi:glycosyltransferase involved in cell wall biosynthesis